jgi:hypothetical protein
MHQREWTAQECAKLKDLVQQGASSFRASVALHRSHASVRNKARELGCPLPLPAPRLAPTGGIGARISDLTDVTRKLVAVVAADVEGYSRLMGTDEVGTLNADCL